MFSENAQEIARSRYLREDETCIEDMLERVSVALANVEKKYRVIDNQSEIDEYEKEFYDIMATKKFLPAGRTLTNAGTDSPVVANCVVLDIDDSMESIGQTLKEAMILQQQGCGLGFDFSKLRPAGFKTVKSNGVGKWPC